MEDSGQDVLYRYLQDGSMLGSTKELVNRAIRAFWLPFAYQNSSQRSRSEAELRIAAIDCVAQLQAQILLIQECFDLQPLGVTIGSQNSFNPEVLASSNATAIDTPSASLPVLNSPEFFDYDDSVFTTMLNSNSS